MRAVIQRVSKASVTVDSIVVGQIGRGLMILLGVKSTDSEEDLDWLAEKCVNLRIFENAAGKFHHSLLDIEGEALIVSQFTLYGDTRRGRRPSFTDAAPPEIAEPLYEQFVQKLKQKGVYVETGQFAAMMDVEIHNDGPVTLTLDTEDRKRDG
ncbi:D-tyrosyl-tRNA(Tyr) deacylase [candidate division KSB1 bacterium]|nr:D-tyrosyl-tRNA(Tyr) deacylase [candidate division KSB1 bacterium]